MELDLQRHRDMLQGVLSRIRVESEECEELRAQVAREQAPSENGEAILPPLCDSQQGTDMISQTASEEMYLSAVEDESGDETMFVGTSGAEDDLDVSRDNGIWERRRNAIIKNQRMVKLTDKDKVKVKPCNTIVIEEEPPPAPPASGKQLVDVIARLSPQEIGLVVGHLPSSTVENWVVQSSGDNLPSSVGSVFFLSVFKKTFKKKSLFHPQCFLSRSAGGAKCGGLSPL